MVRTLEGGKSRTPKAPFYRQNHSKTRSIPPCLSFAARILCQSETHSLLSIQLGGGCKPLLEYVDEGEPLQLGKVSMRARPSGGAALPWRGSF